MFRCISSFLLSVHMEYFEVIENIAFEKRNFLHLDVKKYHNNFVLLH